MIALTLVIGLSLVALGVLALRMIPLARPMTHRGRQRAVQRTTYLVEDRIDQTISRAIDEMLTTARRTCSIGDEVTRRDQRERKQR
jgi:hypothetical protein